MRSPTYPQWILDIVAPGEVYTHDAAIMSKAITVTLTGLARGCGGRFGAIIATNEGRIVALAHNEVRQTFDITAHAEMLALRRAGQALRTITLQESHGVRLRLFTTCEPCLMCDGAIYWSGLSEVIAATRKDDAEAAGIRQEQVLETATFFARQQIMYRPDFLREEALEIFRISRHEQQG
jgi:guanine deaminase